MYLFNKNTGFLLSPFSLSPVVIGSLSSFSSPPIAAHHHPLLRLPPLSQSIIILLLNEP
ncbi:hypothetical protein MtrunA17_Chr7g0275671 [Medicago truncatula]|uniref:Uncharacterized protein n=1 Tax=Medicago truncatula TaxID=3880 RepID=A0A396HF68_MEDTR|nr:hypothetical protein MtrunA17_Chr7g0275671 [Medicago truncatula]